MVINRMADISYVALAASTAEKPILAVVLTGLTLVFAILVLLCIILVIEGKLFVALGRKKDQAKNSAAKPAEPAAQQTAPVVEPGIPPQVVAAIAAAVHTMSNGGYALRAVSTAKKGKGSWGLAGMAETTEPF